MLFMSDYMQPIIIIIIISSSGITIMLLIFSINL